MKKNNELKKNDNYKATTKPLNYRPMTCDSYFRQCIVLYW